MSTVKKAVQDTLQQDVISDKVRDYANEPYFVKKAEKAKEFLRQHPIPERYLKK
ncbi:hypothetical protein [Mucilaginibacter sp. OK098]|jgi:hypothetical protein|uniref:hypothetical protein n=1 Tax=Mucilaginibacter sp. OK098 TaxID=1855297 RepID=UPI001356335D|nr:hypothetical protein [Mucilaginibacter sp. OK098]